MFVPFAAFKPMPLGPLSLSAAVGGTEAEMEGGAVGVAMAAQWLAPH